MKNDKVFKINPEAAPRGFRNPVSRFLVEHAVGFHKLDRIVADARELQREGVEPDFNAAIDDSDAAPVKPLEPATTNNFPHEPLCTSRGRSGINVIASSSSISV